jgi:hypothetical protein
VPARRFDGGMPRSVRRHTPTHADGRPIKITFGEMQITVTLHFIGTGSTDDRRQLINRTDIAMLSAPAEAAPLPWCFSSLWEWSLTAPRQGQD